MKKLLLLISALALVAAGCTNSQQTTTQTTPVTEPTVNTQTQVKQNAGQPDYTPTTTASTQVYTNAKYGLQITLPTTWEALDNNSHDSTKYDLSFRDKKYNGSYESPGLSISYEAESEGLPDARVFEINQLQNNLITIYFSSGKHHVKATCALYGRTQAEKDTVLSQCNEIIPTLKFTK